MSTSTDYVRARRNFLAPGRRVVRQGDIYHADDPIVTGRASLFEALELPDDDAPVEQTTARPGEKRNTRRSSGRRYKATSEPQGDQGDAGKADGADGGQGGASGADSGKSEG